MNDLAGAFLVVQLRSSVIPEDEDSCNRFHEGIGRWGAGGQAADGSKLPPCKCGPRVCGLNWNRFHPRVTGSRNIQNPDEQDVSVARFDRRTAMRHRVDPYGREGHVHGYDGK